jgi:hypothetical protein
MVYLYRIEGSLCNILKLINQVKLPRAITVLFWLIKNEYICCYNRLFSTCDLCVLCGRTLLLGLIVMMMLLRFHAYRRINSSIAEALSSVS